MWFKNKINDKNINYNDLPKHIGIIMDGNGRWAKKRGLPRSAGHSVGADNLKKIVEYANEIGLEYITVYAFSTENWKRPKDEVDYLMDLLLDYLINAEKTLAKDNTRIRVIGSRKELSDQMQKQINKVENLTKNRKGTVLNLALNYGGREEIISSIKSIIEDVENKSISKDDIVAETIEKYLYTNNQPSPDLIIRTSGEQRLSNFLLWQSAYSEFWFTNKLWPDFKKDDLLKAIYDYQNRSRRFGGV